MTITGTLTAEDVHAIRETTEQRWTKTILARDWEGMLALCAPDIVYMPADHPALRGHAQLRTWFDQFPRVLGLTQPLESVVGQGSLAIVRATFAATVDVEGKPTAGTGKVLCSFQHDVTGRWMVTSVCWNWDKPFA
jgi:ketosteroid isomerase-like protein